MRNHDQESLEGEEFVLEEGSGISKEDQQEKPFDCMDIKNSFTFSFISPFLN